VLQDGLGEGGERGRGGACAGDEDGGGKGDGEGVVRAELGVDGDELEAEDGLRALGGGVAGGDISGERRYLDVIGGVTRARCDNGTEGRGDAARRGA
jgi:hypothetical protein